MEGDPGGLGLGGYEAGKGRKPGNSVFRRSSPQVLVTSLFLRLFSVFI